MPATTTAHTSAITSGVAQAIGVTLATSGESAPRRGAESHGIAEVSVGCVKIRELEMDGIQNTWFAAEILLDL